MEWLPFFPRQGGQFGHGPEHGSDKTQFKDHVIILQARQT